MPKMRRKLPKGIQRRKNGTLLICYKNEFGKIDGIAPPPRSMAIKPARETPFVFELEKGIEYGAP